VPCVVQPSLPDTGLLQQGLPLVLIAAGVNWLAIRLCEHPAAVVPLGARVLSLVALKFTMFNDQLEELIW
jgi:hypothetical protein